MLDMIEQLDGIIPTAMTGRLVRTVGTTAAVAGFRAPLRRNGRNRATKWLGCDG